MIADFADFVYPRHVHETFAIGLIEEGAQNFVTRAGNEIMPAGKLCVIDPDIAHEGSKGAERGWRYRMFYPSTRVVAHALDLTLSRAEQIGFSRFVIDDTQLFDYFMRLHTVAMDPYDSGGTQELATEFLRIIFDRYAACIPETTTPRVARLCADYLDAHILQTVSIATLAHIAGVSETQVIRDFKRTLGISPHAYQIARRIDRAKEFLATGEPAAHVAVRCGFADQSHLTRHFHRLVGVTPARFAKHAMM